MSSETLSKNRKEMICPEQFTLPAMSFAEQLQADLSTGPGVCGKSFPSLPYSSPVIPLFCSCPNFLDELAQNACYAGYNYRRL